MDEVNVNPIDLRPELRELVQPGLRSSPVVLQLPVSAEVLDVIQRNPLRPVRYRLAFGPARAGKAPPQVIQVSFRNLDLKRDDLLTSKAGATERAGLLGFAGHRAIVLDSPRHSQLLPAGG